MTMSSPSGDDSRFRLDLLTVDEPGFPEALESLPLKRRRPVMRPWHKAALLGLLVLVFDVAVLMMKGRLEQVLDMSLPTGALASLVQASAAVLLVFLLNKSLIPSAHPGFRAIALTMSGAALLAIGVMASVHFFPPSAGAAHAMVSSGMKSMAGIGCTSHSMMMATPFLVVFLIFVGRGFNLRPVLSGAVAGLSAGLISDALVHLGCSNFTMNHRLTWHFGAVIITTLVGAVAGFIIHILRHRRRDTD